MLQINTCSPDIPLSLSTLTLLKWDSSSGCQHRFRLVNKVSSKWRRFGYRFGREENEIEALEDQCRGKASQCWCKVMGQWLEDGGTDDYPATWRGVVTLLEDVEFYEVARKLEMVLALVTPPPLVEDVANVGLKCEHVTWTPDHTSTVTLPTDPAVTPPPNSGVTPSHDPPPDSVLTPPPHVQPPDPAPPETAMTPPPEPPATPPAFKPAVTPPSDLFPPAPAVASLSEPPETPSPDPAVTPLPEPPESLPPEPAMTPPSQPCMAPPLEPAVATPSVTPSSQLFRIILQIWAIIKYYASIPFRILFWIFSCFEHF